MYMTSDISQYITTDPLLVMRVLRHICGDQLGTFSNGSPAFWIKGEPLRSPLKVDGCLLILTSDYLQQRRRDLGAGQISIDGVYTAEIIQYDNKPETQAKFREIKHLLTNTLDNTHWRPATALRGQYTRAMCHIGFSFISNRCIPKVFVP